VHGAEAAARLAAGVTVRLEEPGDSRRATGPHDHSSSMRTRGSSRPSWILTKSDASRSALAARASRSVMVLETPSCRVDVSGATDSVPAPKLLGRKASAIAAPSIIRERSATVRQPPGPTVEPVRALTETIPFGRDVITYSSGVVITFGAEGRATDRPTGASEKIRVGRASGGSWAASPALDRRR
jgi:hypothetical protein